MKNFFYLIEKINNAKIVEYPFSHIYIENFFNDLDFQNIVEADSINTRNFKNNNEMFNSLFDHGYKTIDFPGCISDVNEYCDWHENKITSKKMNTACESFGMTLRLMEPQSEILVDLKNFIESKEFNEAIAKKFNISRNSVYSDHGIQKYLDGYEISPHPDIRKKALTYMININPHSSSESLNHHTEYLTLKKEYKYVESFWEGNQEFDRCWIPWEWAESKFVQNQNNSLVMFSPSNNSIHAIKALYNHLHSQRTQLYGNLWYENFKSLQNVEWENLIISPSELNSSSKKYLSRLRPFSILQKIKSKINIFSNKTKNYSDVRNRK